MSHPNIQQKILDTDLFADNLDEVQESTTTTRPLLASEQYDQTTGLNRVDNMEHMEKSLEALRHLIDFNKDNPKNLDALEDYIITRTQQNSFLIEHFPTDRLIGDIQQHRVIPETLTEAALNNLTGLNQAKTLEDLEYAHRVLLKLISANRSHITNLDMLEKYLKNTRWTNYFVLKNYTADYAHALINTFQNVLDKERLPDIIKKRLAETTQNDDSEKARIDCIDKLIGDLSKLESSTRRIGNALIIKEYLMHAKDLNFSNYNCLGLEHRLDYIICRYSPVYEQFKESLAKFIDSYSLYHDKKPMADKAIQQFHDSIDKSCQLNLHNREHLEVLLIQVRGVLKEVCQKDYDSFRYSPHTLYAALNIHSGVGQITYSDAETGTYKSTVKKLEALHTKLISAITQASTVKKSENAKAGLLTRLGILKFQEIPNQAEKERAHKSLVTVYASFKSKEIPRKIVDEQLREYNSVFKENLTLERLEKGWQDDCHSSFISTTKS